MNNVNHPSHYNQEGKKECIVEMQELFGVRFVIDFCIGNSYKYLYRRGNKDNNSYEQDTEKAMWYLDYALNLAKEHNLDFAKFKIGVIKQQFMKGDNND